MAFLPWRFLAKYLLVTRSVLGLHRNACRLLGVVLFNILMLTGYKVVLWRQEAAERARLFKAEATLAVGTLDAKLSDADRHVVYGATFLCPEKNELLRGRLEVNVTRAAKQYRVLSHLPERKNFTTAVDVLGKPIEIAGNESRVAAIFSPNNCQPSQTVAFIIPFRYREKHLTILLGHLVPILQRQLIEYSVFVVAQKGHGVFNKGRLMNTGFHYAVEAGIRAGIRPFDCFIFHDVDLLVEHDTLLHRCVKGQNVTHLSVSIDKFDYRPICCGMTVGGVLGFTGEQFVKVNGYPNVYWGWGGEDDDMNARIVNQKFGITRTEGELGRYTMIKHGADKGNPWTVEAMKKLAWASRRFATDGLSNLDTRIITVERFPLFTKILVDVGTASESPVDFS